MERNQSQISPRRTQRELRPQPRLKSCESQATSSEAPLVAPVLPLVTLVSFCGKHSFGQLLFLCQRFSGHKEAQNSQKDLWSQPRIAAIIAFQHPGINRNPWSKFLSRFSPGLQAKPALGVSHISWPPALDSIASHVFRLIRLSKIRLSSSRPLPAALQHLSSRLVLPIRSTGQGFLDKRIWGQTNCGALLPNDQLPTGLNFQPPT